MIRERNVIGGTIKVLILEFLVNSLWLLMENALDGIHCITDWKYVSAWCFTNTCSLQN